MTHYATCQNCAVDKAQCERRQALRKSLKGHGVTSLKFTCPDRKAHFEPGQRVTFTWVQWWNDGYDSDCATVRFKATILQEKGAKFILQVDDEPDLNDGIPAKDVFKNENLIIKVRPADITAIDEPSKKVCPACLGFEDGGQSRCFSFDGYQPDGCLGLPKTFDKEVSA